MDIECKKNQWRLYYKNVCNIYGPFLVRFFTDSIDFHWLGGFLEPPLENEPPGMTKRLEPVRMLAKMILGKPDPGPQ